MNSAYKESYNELKETLIKQLKILNSLGKDCSDVIGCLLRYKMADISQIRSISEKGYTEFMENNSELEINRMLNRAFAYPILFQVAEGQSINVTSLYHWVERRVTAFDKEMVGSSKREQRSIKYMMKPIGNLSDAKEIVRFIERVTNRKADNLIDEMQYGEKVVVQIFTKENVDVTIKIIGAVVLGIGDNGASAMIILDTKALDANSIECFSVAKQVREFLLGNVTNIKVTGGLRITFGPGVSAGILREIDSKMNKRRINDNTYRENESAKAEKVKAR